MNKFKTRRDAELAVFQYIEGFYIKRRRHEAMGRISPKEFRACWERTYGLVGAGNHSAGWGHGVKDKSVNDLERALKLLQLLNGEPMPILAGICGLRDCPKRARSDLVKIDDYISFAKTETICSFRRGTPASRIALSGYIKCDTIQKQCALRIHSALSPFPEYVCHFYSISTTSWEQASSLRNVIISRSCS